MSKPETADGIGIGIEWEEVLDVLCKETVAFHKKCFFSKKPINNNNNDWCVNFEDKTSASASASAHAGVTRKYISATPTDTAISKMRGRFDQLVVRFKEEGGGLVWRRDSRLLKKHVRCGRPKLDDLMESFKVMKFLHEHTTYQLIKDSIFPKRACVHLEPSIRATAIVNYLNQPGNTLQDIPKSLRPKTG